MKRFTPIVLVAMLTAASAQSPGHPFDAAQIHASIDTFVIVTRVTGAPARTIGGIVQTIARDTSAIRIALEYQFVDSRQRVEMAMNAKTLAPFAHWETLSAKGRGDTHGEVRFSEGRARGAFISSKRVFDVALDTAIIDDDASTVLLPALPLDVGKTFTFRTFASPGQVEQTRVHVAGIEQVAVPAGNFDAWRLVVMARDTSTVFVSRTTPRRVVLVRLGDGTQEMALINR